jgi:hypothetical protein
MRGRVGRNHVLNFWRLLGISWQIIQFLIVVGDIYVYHIILSYLILYYIFI